MEHVMSISGTGYTVPEEWMPLWMLVFAAVNVVLRLDTRTPVGKAND
jgi:hypothetical protein